MFWYVEECHGDICSLLEEGGLYMPFISEGRNGADIGMWTPCGLCHTFSPFLAGHVGSHYLMIEACKGNEDYLPSVMG